MRRLSLWMACLGVTVALSGAASTAMARTDVSINLRIGDPYRGPRLVFRDEPDIVLVPGTRVYYVRDYDYDIYRYGSYWYYTYDGNWYRARRYDGPFVFVGYNSVPRAVTYVPVKYRRHWRQAPPGHAYGHYKVKEVKRDRGWKENDRGSKEKDRGWKDDDRGHGRGHKH
jgi:hypothetical protein